MYGREEQPFKTFYLGNENSVAGPAIVQISNKNPGIFQKQFFSLKKIAKQLFWLNLQLF